jgi:hypothetical protein
VTRASDSARRIHAEALELQRRFAETPVETSEPRRQHPALHASLMILTVTLASAALLLLLLARPALS